MAMDFPSASLSPYLAIFLYLFIIAPQTLANCPTTPSKGPIAPLPPLPAPTLPVPIPGLPSVPVPPVTVPPIIPPIDKPPVHLPPVVPNLPTPKIIPPIIPPIDKPPVPLPPVVPTLPTPKIIPPTLPIPTLPIPKIPKLIPPVLPSPPAPKSPCPPPPAPKPKPKPKPCPPPAFKCPVDTLKLGTCLEVLGATWHIGDPAVKCCPLIAGLTSVGAALCLCTAIKANALGLEVFLPIALELLVTCGKEAPPGYSCK